MKFLLLCMWTWVVLVLMGRGRSMVCLDEERNALLKIKASFNHPNGSSLPSWGEGDMDCCGWFGVVCDNATLRVTRLDLVGTRDWELPSPWVIDASLFLPLEELQELDLSFNSLSDINGTQHLKKLKMLDLSYNHLQRVPSLYKHTSGEDQNVPSTQLEEVNLEVLDLSGNNLVNDALADITRITSLKALHIRLCELNASKLLKGLCGLRKLQVLDISDNELWAPLPSCFSNLTSLQRLDVSYNDFSGAIPSCFSNLTSLQRLDVSHNSFSGAIPSCFSNPTSLQRLDVSYNSFSGAIPSCFSNLTSLQQLHVSHNNFSGAIPSCFSNLTSLQRLDVSDNDFSGAIPSCFSNPTSLQQLDVSNNDLSGAIPSSLLPNLKSLEFIDFSGNAFEGSLSLAPLANNSKLESFSLLNNRNRLEVNTEEPTWFPSFQLKDIHLSDCVLNKDADGVIPSFLKEQHDLEAVELSHSGMKGKFPIWLFVNNSNLEILVLSGNNLSGALHWPANLSLGGMSYNQLSLQQLDVSGNAFSGAIPSSLLSNLKSLEYIDFSGNAFGGSLSLASLANNSKLESFSLLNNRNRLEVNTEEPTWFPSSQLKDFRLSNCILNKDMDGVIPSFLKEQYNLEEVELSHSGMKGKFPSWLLVNNSNLEILVLSGNNLSGALHWPANLSLGGMWDFDVSANAIDRELPSWIGYVLPNLRHLNLSNNLLEGKIPSSMGNMKGLWTLDLSCNDFTGDIPEPLAKNCTVLSTLILSGNNLQGEMLPRNSNLPFLQVLYLDNNRFTGKISPDILKSSSLYVLDVSNNSLSGTLPDWIGDFQYLSVLMLSSNLFGGPLPLSFDNLHNLMILDLSSINLGPNTLSYVNVTNMRFLHLSNAKLTGHFPEFLSRASSIVTLDLRHNALSGEIPNWIASLQNLKVLLLQGNNFEGSIPLDLCLLKNMTILDLSNNDLFGKIPPCLKDLTFGNDGASTDFFADLGRLIQWIEGYLHSPVIGLEKVNFMTKSRLELYTGHILQLMSGMDLSQNNLTGFIPLEVGHLRGLRALNLSHNHLTGPIPETFSNLKNVESLDLSYNSLTGPIPPQLTELYALSNFRVAYNNLSGRTPDRKNQFGTFDEASYEGNPLLCGAPLKSCDGSNQKHGTPPSINHTQEDDAWREAFLWSFAGSYVVAFLGVVLFLCLNPYYQWLLFDLVRKLVPSLPT